MEGWRRVRISGLADSSSHSQEDFLVSCAMLSGTPVAVQLAFPSGSLTDSYVRKRQAKPRLVPCADRRRIRETDVSAETASSGKTRASPDSGRRVRIREFRRGRVSANLFLGRGRQ